MRSSIRVSLIILTFGLQGMGALYLIRSTLALEPLELLAMASALPIVSIIVTCFINLLFDGKFAFYFLKPQSETIKS